MTFVKGQSGNPKGRPKGSVSIITKIKKKFEENPEYFDEYISQMLEDPALRRHIMEQIDGKPKQTVDTNIDFPTSLIELIKGSGADKAE